MLSTSGTFIDTFPSSLGCDSIVTLVLDVLQQLQTDLIDSICAGDSYNFNGQIITIAGNYSVLLSTSQGCDSLVTLNLSILPESRTDLIENICAGETFNFNGSIFSTTGFFTDTLIAANGCDSIITLDLTVEPIYSESIEAFVCEGDTYIFGGVVLDSSGTYIDSLTSVNGCDSVIVLDLTVQSPIQHELEANICTGQTYPFGGQLLDMSGTYMDTFLASGGCDSIVTLVLVVSDAIMTSLADTICTGETYAFNGQILSVAGTYSETLTSQAGCDSIVTLNLAVLPTLNSTLNEEICEGDTYNFQGQAINSSGVFVDTLSAVMGCDSIVTLNLTVHPIQQTALDTSICEGATVTFSGLTLNSTGIYIDTLTAVNGCDSILTLNLVVHAVDTTFIDATICTGSTYDFLGTILSNPGTYIETIPSSTGCDSTIILSLNILDQITDSIAEQICLGQTYTFGNSVLSTSGTFIDTFPSSLGCDSIVTLVLDVLQQLQTDLIDSICTGDSYIFNGQIITTAGNYSVLLSTSQGCDSLVTLNLSVLPESRTDLIENICAGETFNFNGSIFSTTGFFNDTLIAANGCDSIITLDLTVEPIYNESIEAFVCEGDTYIFGGVVLDSSGTYIDSLTSVNGCDSVIVLDLTVQSPIQHELEANICTGQVFPFGGQLLDMSGTYLDTFLASGGCDSIVTLVLVVSDAIMTSLADTICVGETYAFHGQILSIAGTYSETLTSQAGCDSIVTLNLAVLPTLNSTLNEEICEGDTYDFHGQSLNSSGIFVDTLTANMGCDSIVTLNLVVHPIQQTALDTSICEGATVTFSGLTLNSTGIYTDTLTTSNGCDSILTLNLVVHAVDTTLIDATICTGSTYDFLGTILSNPGTYIETIPSSTGCDSTIILTLDILDQITDSIAAQICLGQTYTFGNRVLSTSGTYIDTITSSFGCDSIVTLMLEVLEQLQTNLTDTICAGEVYDFNGQLISSAGSYTQTLSSQAGCDSLVTLDLTLLPTEHTTLDTAICQGDAYLFNNQTLLNSGTYHDTLTANSGCDSIITLDLTVEPIYSESIEAFVCEGDTYIFGGVVLDSSGTYIDSLTSVNGCDSVIVLDLTVQSPIQHELEANICTGQVFPFGGQLLDMSGTYLDTFLASGGCDSIVTLVLVVSDAIMTSLADTICVGETYAFNGQILAIAGTYSETLTSQAGCDSIVTLDLAVLPTLNSTLNEEICEGDTYNFQGQAINSSGVFVDTLSAVMGCDSIVTLNLTVHPIQQTALDTSICEGATVTFSGLTLNSTGIYTDTLTTGNGCDSILTLNLVVHAVDTTFIDATICTGSTYDFLGTILSTPGTYIETIPSSTGCDSTIILTLNILDQITDSIAAQICLGQTYTFGNRVLSTSGTYIDTITSSFGCDSIVTLMLEVLEQLQTNLTDTICAGEVYDFNGQLISSAGSYTQTLSSQAGCDSLVNLDLTLLPAEHTTLDTAICQGDAYLFNNQTLLNSGTYHDTLTANSGCDSIITLNLTVTPVYNTSIEAAICEGSTYVFGGTILDTNGTYVDSLSSVNGCDSIVTLHLTVQTSILTIIDAQICTGQNYPFAGMLLSASGTYVDTLTSAGGCDSVVALNLEVLDQLQTNLTDTICQGDSYDFNGQSLTVTGTYSVALNSQAGCDSLVNLQLTVIPHVDTTINAQICQGDFFEFHGQTISASGTYQQTLSSAAGCDSIVTLMLTVNPTAHTLLDTTICAGAFIDFNGQGLSTPGTYTDSLTTNLGCDSIVTLELFIQPLDTTEIQVTICTGSTYDFLGTILTTPGTYGETIPSSSGCDSTITLTLDILDQITDSIATQICLGQTYTFGNRVLSTSGTYIDTITSSFGCDSIVTLMLEVLEQLQTNLTDTICAGEVYDFNGQLISSAGSYTQTLSSQAGCDSLVTLDLTLLPTENTTLDTAICQGEAYLFNNQTLLNSGTYHDTLTANSGCDSIITLNLTVTPVYNTSIEAAICEGSTYVFGGTILDTNGTYVDSLSSVNGCDSIVTLHLTVQTSILTIIDAQICTGQNYPFAGMLLSASGTYVDTLTSAGGCDSVVTLNLEVLDQLQTNLTDTICQGDSYDFNGQSLTVTGTYSVALNSQAGCDSLVNLQLTVIPHVDTTINAQICQGDFFDFHGQTISASGTYQQTLSSAAGCDSIVTLMLTVNPTAHTLLDTTICAGAFIDFNGQGLSTPGTYTDSLTTNLGCDSIVTLELFIQPLDTTEIQVTICTGSTYDFLGTILTTPGTYGETIPSSSGCDSTIILTLDILDQITDSIATQICLGQTYTFGNRVLSTSGTYIDTITSSFGCDSIVTLMLEVLEQLQTNLTDTICAGEVYDFNGQLISSAGSYTQTLSSQAGCDSLVTLDLTLLPTENTTLDTAICQGEAYLFNNQTLLNSGTYHDTLTANSGCDSIITLNLTVTPVYNTSIEAAICEGSTYVFGGTILDTNGTYVDSLSSVNGCDSIVTLHLTVQTSILTIIDAQICTGQNYPFAGMLLSASGTYVDTLTSAGGCDSVVTLNLEVLDQLQTNLTDTICQGDSYDFNGQSLTVTGTYSVALNSQAGCDSLVNLQLTVIPHVDTTINAQICQGDFFDFHGQTISASGTYQQTLSSAAGCDSIVTLMLTVNPTAHTLLDTTICAGAFIDFSGQGLSTPGTYTDSLTTNLGCDSIVTLELFIQPLDTTYIQVTICTGSNYDFLGTILTTPGTYGETIPSSSGCDSTIILTLDILDQITDSIATQICLGQTYTFGNRVLSTSGTYIDTITSSFGCDSIVTLVLNIIDKKQTNLSTQLCPGETLEFGAITIFEEGIYHDTLTAGDGCDSIVTLAVSVSPIGQSTFSYTICEGEEVIVAGKAYAESGVYSDTISTTFGCDSIIEVTIAIAGVASLNQEISICEGTSYSFAGQELTTSGTYHDTLVNANGCDSIITVVLTVEPPSQKTIEAQVCQGQQYLFGGQFISVSGIYHDTLVTMSGCDSIVILNLAVKDVLTDTVKYTICEGSEILINDVPYGSAQNFTDTLESTAGCDSLVTREILVVETEFTASRDSICEGSSYLFNEEFIYQSGVYYDTLLSKGGCDSIAELTLEVIPSIVNQVTVEICFGNVYTTGGQSYSESGNYELILESSNGCDSIIMLTLIVVEPIITQIETSLCQGDSIEFHGQIIHESGQYVDTLITKMGCDSIIILTIEILPQYETIQHYRICDGDSVLILDNWYSEETKFSEENIAANGCDSVNTYIVEIIPDIILEGDGAVICEGESVQLSVSGHQGSPLSWQPPESLSCTDCPNPIANPQVTTTYVVTTIGCEEQAVSTEITVEVIPRPTLKVNEIGKIQKGDPIELQGFTEPGNKIDWYNQTEQEVICENCPTATDKPEKTTTYQATATSTVGCPVLRELTVTVEDECEIEKIEVVNAFTPNNDGVNDFFDITNEGISRIGQVRVFNRWGEKVFEHTGTDLLWDGSFRGIDVNPGVYVYTIEAICVSGDQRFLHGNVTVIR